MILGTAFLSLCHQDNKLYYMSHSCTLEQYSTSQRNLLIRHQHLSTLVMHLTSSLRPLANLLILAKREFDLYCRLLLILTMIRLLIYNLIDFVIEIETCERMTPEFTVPVPLQKMHFHCAYAPPVMVTIASDVMTNFFILCVFVLWFLV